MDINFDELMQEYELFFQILQSFVAGTHLLITKSKTLRQQKKLGEKDIGAEELLPISIDMLSKFTPAQLTKLDKMFNFFYPFIDPNISEGQFGVYLVNFSSAIRNILGERPTEYVLEKKSQKAFFPAENGSCYRNVIKGIRESIPSISQQKNVNNLTQKTDWQTILSAKNKEAMQTINVELEKLSRMKPGSMQYKDLMRFEVVLNFAIQSDPDNTKFNQYRGILFNKYQEHFKQCNKEQLKKIESQIKNNPFLLLGDFGQNKVSIKIAERALIIVKKTPFYANIPGQIRSMFRMFKPKAKNDNQSQEQPTRSRGMSRSPAAGE